MSIVDTVKRFLGIPTIDIGELNRQATRLPSVEVTKPVIKNLLDGIHVTDEYKQVHSLIKTNYPIIFVTGNAGTGKSTLIQYLRSVLNKNMIVLAPTGVAALNVEGVTIHSFFHLPPRIHNDEDIKIVQDRKLYQKLELLIIDEISMVRCDLLDSIDKFLRKNRSTDIPFGGVQLLLIGDLFQLPPVTKRKEREILRAKGYASHHFFSSFSLQKSSFIPFELTSTYRQKDSLFISLLNNVRTGEEVESTIAKLNEHCFQKEQRATNITLTCTNSLADQINKRELQKLHSKEYTFQGEIIGKFNIEEDKLPSPLNLKLKVGAHVMFTKNDGNRRWVNGSLGIVRSIENGNIAVETRVNQQKSIYDVKRVRWETYKYSYSSKENKIVSEVIGEYTQFPLTLAWAVTIHKSQGKTLQKVLLDLGNGTFDYGQLYVALSRCRSMDGIQLARSIKTADVLCDPVIKRFFSTLDTMVNKNNNNELLLAPNQALKLTE